MRFEDNSNKSTHFHFSWQTTSTGGRYAPPAACDDAELQRQSYQDDYLKACMTEGVETKDLVQELEAELMERKAELAQKVKA